MITYLIIFITVASSIMGFQSLELFNKYKFNPYAIHNKKEWYRFITHAFLHADWAHLIFNMFTLFFFGKFIESVYQNLFGNKYILYYLLLYVGSILFSSLPAFAKNKNNSWYNSIGASGAVSAVLFSFILFNPWSLIGVFFIPVPAVLFGISYLIYSAYMAKRMTDNIGHDAHFFGAIFGIGFTIILKPELVFLFIKKLLFLM